MNFTLIITPETLAAAGLILILRILNSAISTIRLITLARQQKLITAVLSFFEALTFAVTVAGVVTDLNNLLNLFAYCFGFSAGGFLGMTLEKRLITSYSIVNVFSADRGHEIAAALRRAGFGVTETVGEGLHGPVTMLRSVTTRRDLPKLTQTIHGVQPDAFIAVEEARSVTRGYIGAARRMSAE